jgi:hypothetical protein
MNKKTFVLLALICGATPLITATQTHAVTKSTMLVTQENPTAFGKVKRFIADTSDTVKAVAVVVCVAAAFWLKFRNDGKPVPPAIEPVKPLVPPAIVVAPAAPVAKIKSQDPIYAAYEVASDATFAVANKAKQGAAAVANATKDTAVYYGSRIAQHPKVQTAMAATSRVTSAVANTVRQTAAYYNGIAQQQGPTIAAKTAWNDLWAATSAKIKADRVARGLPPTEAPVVTDNDSFFG